MNIDCEIIEKEGFFALLNKKSEAQTDFEFTEIKPISDNHFSCCKENEYYILGSRGNIITNGAQQHFQWFLHDRILAKRDDKYGFIDINDRVTIPFKYDEIIARDKLFDVRIDNRWGIMNVFGKELTHIKYTESIVFTDSKIAFVTDSLSGRKGVLNSYGNEIIPSIYTFIIQDDDNPQYLYAAIEGTYDENSRNFFSEHIYNARWGCFDITGKSLIPVLYDCIKTVGNYLYAGWGGDFLQKGQWSEYENLTEYSGVYDLYNKDGIFLIGGFDLFNVDLGKLFFHFGGSWKTERDEYSYHSYSFETWNGKWVVTDANLDSLIRVNDEIYNIAQNGKRIVYKRVKVEKPRTPTKYDSSTTQTSIETQISLPSDILFYMSEGEIEPTFSNDNVIITGNNWYKRAVFAKEKIITDVFDEIEAIDESTIFIKKDGLCGIMTFKETLIDIKYFAITEPICGYIITVTELENKHFKCELLNLNDITKEPIIVYDELTLEEMGEKLRYQYIRLEWLNKSIIVLLEDIGLRGYEDETLNSEFRKLICQQPVYYDSNIQRYWFPRNDMNFRTYENSTDSDEPNYEEDTWDAMTDGMYGDYPGGDVDYDKFGF